MRIILYFLISLIFIGCGNLQPQITSIKNEPKKTIKKVKTIEKPQIYPQWYKYRRLQSTVQYEIIGYGEGKTFKEAESNAKEDIALTLISKIDSSFTAQTSSYKNNFNETYSKKNESKLRITSNINLHNLKTVKQEELDNIFYVALKYKNLDLAYRIKTTIGNFKCDEKQYNNYLSQTPLIKKLSDSIGCQLNFKLDRRNEAWYLKYNEYLFLLTDSEYEELYISKKNDNFKFLSNKKVLTDGNSFYFTLNSKQSGYITLFNVYENGITTLLQPSIPINKIIQIPPEYGGSYFEAGLVKDGVNTYDLYVAIYTQEPLDMSRFEYANEDLAESELAYKFDELIQVMTEYEYSSIFIRTISK